MQYESRESLLTFKGAKWLILFVFYLQFLVPEFIKMNWSFISQNDVPDYIMLVSIQIFAVAVPCIIFMFLNSLQPSKVLKINKISKSAGFICVLIGISAQPISSLLNMPALMYVSKRMGELPSPVVNTPTNFAGLLTGFLIVALLPAIFEEVLMRGILLSSLETHGYRASIFISSFLFAIIHNKVETFLGIFFLGMILCYVVWMTQSIFAGIIVHFSFNAFGLILDYIINANINAYPWVGGTIFHVVLIFVAIIIFSLVIGTINRTKVKRYKTNSFFKELFFAIFDLPIILVILGYIMFEFGLKYI